MCMRNFTINNIVLDKIMKIKMLAMDVDGTLTDGSMYYSENGEQLKRFNVRDGMSIHLLENSGIIPAIITSENSSITKARAKKLNISQVILGSRNKTEDIKKLALDNNIKLEEIAYIGDDINDLHVIKIVGFSGCPADSTELIKQNVDYICKSEGGRGAVREFVELILINQKKDIYLQENW